MYKLVVAVVFIVGQTSIGSAALIRIGASISPTTTIDVIAAELERSVIEYGICIDDELRSRNPNTGRCFRDLLEPPVIDQGILEVTNTFVDNGIVLGTAVNPTTEYLNVVETDFVGTSTISTVGFRRSSTQADSGVGQSEPVVLANLEMYVGEAGPEVLESSEAAFNVLDVRINAGASLNGTLRFDAEGIRGAANNVDPNSLVSFRQFTPTFPTDPENGFSTLVTLPGLELAAESNLGRLKTIFEPAVLFEQGSERLVFTPTLSVLANRSMEITGPVDDQSVTITSATLTSRGLDIQGGGIVDRGSLSDGPVVSVNVPGSSITLGNGVGDECGTSPSAVGRIDRGLHDCLALQTTFTGTVQDIVFEGTAEIDGEEVIFYGAVVYDESLDAQVAPNEETLFSSLPSGGIPKRIVLDGTLSDIVTSEPVLTNGLSQFWYEGSMRGNVEAFQNAIAEENGTDANPLVAPAFASDTTWWAGSQGTNVVSDLTLERYPSQGLAGTRFEGSGNEDNYSVVLRGEIRIKEDGEYLIRDGIDDFTLIAIDQDGNGELDDYDTISSGDVGGAGFGDILVLDDDWANLDGSSQENPEFHGIAEFENIGPDGDWRRIEVWMSEGGGGDGGIVYLGRFDDPDIFDEHDDGALTQEQRDKFVIRSEDLRTMISVVESANADAKLPTNVEYVLNAYANGTSDQITIDDNDGIYTTTLDVSGATIRIAAAEGIRNGASFRIIDANIIVGADQITLNGIDLSQWTFDAATGLLMFGDVVDPFFEADCNEDGKVDFSDFLELSTKFNQPVDPPGSDCDINGDGIVNFPDFLVLSSQFGLMSSRAASVPEPSSYAPLGMLVVLILRRPRL